MLIAANIAIIFVGHMETMIIVFLFYFWEDTSLAGLQSQCAKCALIDVIQTVEVEQLMIFHVLASSQNKLF